MDPWNTWGNPTHMHTEREQERVKDTKREKEREREKEKRKKTVCSHFSGINYHNLGNFQSGKFFMKLEMYKI